MSTSLHLKHTVLVLALAAIYPVQANAAVSAGVAQFIAGDVNVRRPDGGIAPLAKGKDIESGESILTGINGRAQVKFSDGGLISLQPNTEFKIANYSDNAANPKEERFLVDLLRGSMRAITGLIGKRNRDNYKVTTTTATIGIRGSGFNVGYNPDGSLGVTTELDAIEVCNAGGCVGLTAGESVRVVNATDAPVRTNVKAPVPTPSPERDPVTVGDKTTSDGKSAIVSSSNSGNNGTFTNLAQGAAYALSGAAPTPTGSGPSVATSATLVDGKLTTFTSAGKVFTASTYTTFNSDGSIAGNNFIGWGTWATGARDPGNTAVQNLSYVIGQPTAVLPAGGLLTYAFLGATPVNRQYTTGGASLASGTMLGTSNLTIDLTNLKVGVNIFTDVGNLSVSSAFINLSTNGQFTYSGGVGPTTIDGILTGVNASRAGIVYTGLGNQSSGINTTISGAAVFKAP